MYENIDPDKIADIIVSKENANPYPLSKDLKIAPSAKPKRSYLPHLFLLLIFLISLLVILAESAKYLSKTKKFNISSIPNSGTSLNSNSPNLGILYLVSNNNLFLLDETSNKLVRNSGTNDISNLLISDNSRTLYFLKNADIWSSNIKSGDVKKLTDTGAKVQRFELSPDGKYIAYYHIDSFTACCGSEEAKMAVLSLYFAKSDGSENLRANFPPPKKIYDAYNQAIMETWIPGQEKAVLRGVGLLDASNNFWELDLTTNNLTKFIRYGDYPLDVMPEIHFSPDGKFISYYLNQFTWISDIDGLNRKIITDRELESWLTWSPDSTKLAGQAVNNPGEGASFLVISKDGSVIYDFKASTVQQGFALENWSPDSRYVVARHFDSSAREGGLDKITVIDTKNKSVNEYPLIGRGNVPNIEITGITIAPSNRIYYTLQGVNSNYDDKTLPQLWVIDISTGNQTKIADNAELPRW